jgi:hypothetical protein
MSFVSNGGKFKLYTVLNGLNFPTPYEVNIKLTDNLFFLIKEPPTPQFTPKIDLATLYTFDLG